MESSPWWSKSSAPKQAPKAQDGGAEQSGAFSDDDANSLGEVIDGAIGDLDTKLERLREALDQKRDEIAELEEQIAQTEKSQAKAFKDLLSRNPRIKRMLNPRSKKKTSRRRSRKSATTPGEGQGAQPPPSEDDESLL